MSEWEGLVSLGRAMKTTSSRLGALVQLEGDVAYLVNESRSVALEIKFKKKLGEGTFYSAEAPLSTELVARRDGKVLFQWKEEGKIKRVLVPEKKPVKEKVAEAIGKYFRKDSLVKVPHSFLDDLDEDSLAARLKFEGRELRVIQRRSDGSVELNYSYPLVGKSSEVNSEEVTVFTRDLRAFRGLVSDLFLGIAGSRSPLSVLARTNFNSVLRGVIAYLVYEV